ncbi:hypothetical protein LY78DRAFT_740334 [Colletotrichum sublineola]|nr:hypothetical protein LY78DRAFT_740334 [Colletotrichum sublineola]
MPPDGGQKCLLSSSAYVWESCSELAEQERIKGGAEEARLPRPGGLLGNAMATAVRLLVDDGGGSTGAKTDVGLVWEFSWNLIKDGAGSGKQLSHIRYRPSASCQEDKQDTSTSSPAASDCLVLLRAARPAAALSAGRKCLGPTHDAGNGLGRRLFRGSSSLLGSGVEAAFLLPLLLSLLLPVPHAAFVFLEQEQRFQERQATLDFLGGGVGAHLLDLLTVRVVDLAEALIYV